MESDKKIILVGYSGHSFALLDIAIELGYSIVGYSENKIKSNNPYNLTYLGDEGSDDFKGWKMSNNYIIGIGDNKIREKALKFIKKNNKKIISIICKTSSISKTAIQNTCVVFPKNMEEQAVIGNYFQKLDALITQHQQQIIKLKNIKQACLSKMFV